MELKPGSRWRSDVCDAEVIIVRPPSAEASLKCGGVEMKPATDPRGERQPKTGASGEGPLIGKRYFDGESGLELLCNKAGDGVLSFADRPLDLKEAKQLPSSD